MTLVLPGSNLGSYWGNGATGCSCSMACSGQSRRAAEVEEVLVLRRAGVGIGVLRALGQQGAMSVEYVSRQAHLKAR